MPARRKVQKRKAPPRPRRTGAYNIGVDANGLGVLNRNRPPRRTRALKTFTATTNGFYDVLHPNHIAHGVYLDAGTMFTRNKNYKR